MEEALDGLLTALRKIYVERFVAAVLDQHLLRKANGEFYKRDTKLVELHWNEYNELVAITFRGEPLWEGQA